LTKTLKALSNKVFRFFQQALVISVLAVSLAQQVTLRLLPVLLLTNKSIVKAQALGFNLKSFQFPVP
jgi:energy-coupling factor transporter transmembrane protein EcfT